MALAFDQTFWTQRLYTGAEIIAPPCQPAAKLHKESHLQQLRVALLGAAGSHIGGRSV